MISKFSTSLFKAAGSMSKSKVGFFSPFRISPNPPFSSSTLLWPPSPVRSNLFQETRYSHVHSKNLTLSLQPPTLEESPHARYASVLFTTASAKESLHTILEDVKSLRELYNQVLSIFFL